MLLDIILHLVAIVAILSSGIYLGKRFGAQAEAEVKKMEGNIKGTYTEVKQKADK